MKIKLCLVITLIQIWFLFCNSVRIIYERSFISEYDPDTFEYVSSECNLINRTTRALHIIFKLKRQLEESTTVEIKFYKFINNEYRFALIQFKMKLKDGLSYKLFDLESLMLNYTTPPLKWPIKIMKYELKNYLANGQKFPNIPHGSYKIDLTFKDRNKIIGILTIFAKIF